MCAVWWDLRLSQQWSSVLYRCVDFYIDTRIVPTSPHDITTQETNIYNIMLVFTIIKMHSDCNKTKLSLETLYFHKENYANLQNLREKPSSTSGDADCFNFTT